ncbi:MAG: isoprenylcysteine carboxylmethyltransferase family protein [Rhizobiales bacterium]|nr:isoprenylcysteine carboxylmethyltransferase family protein [Hyphomicrobiales bacterium]MBI3673671.1 isoprenylcysteine carboxylmethyltransferase family protein [Hyphomicrobiales bacterium]
MTTTDWFDAARIADIWAVMVSIAIYQLSIQLRRPAGQRFNEGLPKTLQYAAGVPALATLVAFMIDPDWGGPPPVFSGTVPVLAGLTLFNIAALLVFYSHVTLGRYWSGDLETQADHRLIDRGPYRLVRHPLYTSYFLLTLGLFAMTGNWLVGISMLVYFVTVAFRIPKEEAMMAERLGSPYLAYCRRTGCLLPRLRRSLSPANRSAH